MLLWTVSVYSSLRRSRVRAWQQLEMNQAGPHLSCLHSGCSWLGSNAGYPSLGLLLFYAMFEVLIALTVRTAVFWAVTPYSPVEVHLHFERTVSTFFLPRIWKHYFLPPNVAVFVSFYRLSHSTRYDCCRVYWKLMGRREFSNIFYTEFDASMATWFTNLNFYKNILSINTFSSYFRTLYKFISWYITELTKGRATLTAQNR